jgi:hypothetical protein
MELAHERLENLIDHFAKTPAHTGSLFIPDLHTFENLFIQETTNIKTLLNRKSLPIENERNFELLVHQYQSLIAFWLDKLLRAKKNFKYPEEVVQLITAELEQLLIFMHDRYEKFFNLDGKVPEISLMQIRENLKGRFQKLRRHILKECGNEALTALALSPLHDLLNSESQKKITCRYLFYTRRIEKALLNFSNAKYTGSSWEDKPLIELLVLMNYNHSEVVLFIINKMIGNIEMLETIEDKRDRLRFFLKEFNQLKERTDVAYVPSSTSLKEQIIEWISQEMIYMDKVTPVSKNKGNQPVANEEKLQLSLSVEVVTLISRAAKDNNIITNRHNTDVFKNLSKYVSTKQAETLSVNSMIKKSYAAEKRSKDAAIDVLHGLIKRIHEY